MTEKEKMIELLKPLLEKGIKITQGENSDNITYKELEKIISLKETAISDIKEEVANMYEDWYADYIEDNDKRYTKDKVLSMVDELFDWIFVEKCGKEILVDYYVGAYNHCDEFFFDHYFAASYVIDTKILDIKEKYDVQFGG